MCYFSNGALNVDIAYNLPIYLRNFYYRSLVELKEKEAKSYEESSKKSPKNTGKATVDKPF